MHLVQLPLPMVLPLVLVFAGQVLNYIVVYSTALKVELCTLHRCHCPRSHL